MMPKPNNDVFESEYVRFGMAASIPGIQKAIEYLQEMLRDLRTRLAAMDGPSTARQVIEQAKKFPVKPDGKRGGPGGYWDRMTKEERSAEVKRRMKKANVKAGRLTASQSSMKSRNHPRYPEHPGHAEWLKKISRAQRAAQARKAAA